MYNLNFLHKKDIGLFTLVVH